MPIYEYVCEKCPRIFEVLQKFSDAPIKSCEVCGTLVAKKMSLTQFSLKGTGWYSTDYKSKPKTSELSSGEKARDNAGEKVKPVEAPKAEVPKVEKSPHKSQDKSSNAGSQK